MSETIAWNERNLPGDGLTSNIDVRLGFNQTDLIDVRLCRPANDPPFRLTTRLLLDGRTYRLQWIDAHYLITLDVVDREHAQLWVEYLTNKALGDIRVPLTMLKTITSFSGLERNAPAFSAPKYYVVNNRDWLFKV